MCAQKENERHGSNERASRCRKVILCVADPPIRGQLQRAAKNKSHDGACAYPPKKTEGKIKQLIKENKGYIRERVGRQILYNIQDMDTTDIRFPSGATKLLHDGTPVNDSLGNETENISSI